MTDTSAEIPSAVRMQQLLTGFEVSQALYVIAELGVATALLDGPRSVKELAQATGADPDALGRIIRFLASLGVFQTDGETVTVTDLGRTLADGPPDSVRGLARYWMKTHYAPFGDLLHTARTGEIAAAKHLGRPFFEWISESPQLAEIQNTAMADGGRSARGDLLAAYKLPGNGTVADIGGADGTLLAEFLAGAARAPRYRLRPAQRRRHGSPDAGGCGAERPGNGRGGRLLRNRSHSGHLPNVGRPTRLGQ